MRILADPRIINFILIGLYAANAVRWGIAGRPADVGYWLGALIITLSVTFGYH